MIVKRGNEESQLCNLVTDSTLDVVGLWSVRRNLKYDLEELTLGLVVYTDGLTEDLDIVTRLLPGTFAGNLARRALTHHIPYGFLIQEHVVDVMLIIIIVLRELDRRLRLIGLEV